MNTISDRLLGQYLAGALEPPERRRIERALAELPHAQARLEVLRGGAADEAVDPWILPPPSVPSSLRAVPAPAAVMDTTTSAWLVVRLAVEPSQHDHVVVVLEREADAWEVVFPTSEDERTTVAMLPHEDGQVRLDLAEGPPRRVAVAIVPPTLDLSLEAAAGTRWSELKKAVSAGIVPVVSFDAS